MHSCVFLAVIVVVRATDLAYTTISFSKSGEPCLNDCKNNKCFTHYTLKPHTCTPGNRTAPVYHTYNNRVKSEFTCLSRCGQFGKNYKWCFVSNIGNKWDYCNSETEIRWIKGYQTLHHGACADECKIDNDYEDYMCSNYHNHRHKCHPMEYSYIQAITEYNEKCFTKCDDRYGNGIYECLDKTGARGFCALPAQPPSLSTLFDVPISRIIDCINTSKLRKRCNDIREHFHNISALAKKLEEQNYLQTVSLNEHRNPIYQYTVQKSLSDRDPWVLLALRANITADTIRCVGNNEAESKTGLLIGQRIGGVIKPYNIVPLSVTADESLRKYEDFIYKWVSRIGPVQVTIVVMYKKFLIPFAFGIDYTLLKNGKAYKKIKNEIVYNDLPPENESLGSQWLKKFEVIPI